MDDGPEGLRVAHRVARAVGPDDLDGDHVAQAGRRRTLHEMCTGETQQSDGQKHRSSEDPVQCDLSAAQRAPKLRVISRP
jgi:hypothetical protein